MPCPPTPYPPGALGSSLSALVSYERRKRNKVRDISVSEWCLIVIALTVVLGFLFGWG